MGLVVDAVAEMDPLQEGLAEIQGVEEIDASQLLMGAVPVDIHVRVGRLHRGEPLAGLIHRPQKALLVGIAVQGLQQETDAVLLCRVRDGREGIRQDLLSRLPLLRRRVRTAGDADITKSHLRCHRHQADLKLHGLFADIKALPVHVGS